jgi:hypothetical protein
MPPGLYDEWLAAYTDAGGAGVAGSAGVATETIRNSPSYDTYFPGLRREDGSLRYQYNPEATYFNNIESYRNAVEGIGMNPEIFGEEYIDLIEGDTAPQEFVQRVNTLYDRIEMATTGSDIRNWYAENYGIDMTDKGIIASLMSDNVGQAILEKRISMAEIGGEAASRNFELTNAFVDILEAEGMNRADADRLFGSAQAMLPALQGLAIRHADPDDDFDIEEFASGVALQNPEQLARLERLRSQEQSQFTGGRQTDIALGATGGIGGLAER